jgi:hypothetical protein
MRLLVRIDGPQQVVVFLQRAERTVPVHQRRMPAPIAPLSCSDTASVVVTERMRLRVRIAILCVKASIDEHFLDVHSFAQDWQIDCPHIVPMHPNLAHYYIGRPLALHLGRRCPDMFREVAQPRGGGAIGLEDSLVAEQDRDGDGQDNGEQPMPRRRRAMGLERPPDGVRSGKRRWFGRTVASRLVWHTSCAYIHERLLTHAADIGDTRSYHSGSRCLSKGMPGLELDEASAAAKGLRRTRRRMCCCGVWGSSSFIG